MKTGFFAASALSLLGLAAAQPSKHRRAHQHLHEKRDVVTVTDYVTATAADVVIYVDANGNALYTSYPGGQTPTTSAASVASTANTVVYTVANDVASSAAAATSVVVVASSEASSAAYSAPASSAESSVAASSAASSSQAASSSKTSSSASSSSTGTASGGYGISYSPYNDDGTCKDQDAVNSDFESLDASTYSIVRIYGTDCNQVATVLSAASAKGFKLFAGVYDIFQVTSELEVMISAVNGDWSSFDTISIGNEGVDSGRWSVSDLQSAMTTARSTLKAAGYTGSIVAVDTFTAIIANPGICSCSDYAAANAHAFFDGSIEAADSGPWLVEQFQRVSSACNGMDTMITETGWPTKGDTNDLAVPSVANQKAALSSILDSVSSNVIFFTAFNDMWKTSSSTQFNAEQYWGILN